MSMACAFSRPRTPFSSLMMMAAICRRGTQACLTTTPLVPSSGDWPGGCRQLHTYSTKAPSETEHSPKDMVELESKLQSVDRPDSA
eukprot:117459-Chlamydomonas_euryale.AAC.2